MTLPAPFRTEACRSCGAPVIWSSTVSGNWMPVDAEPSDDGNIELVLDRSALRPRAVVGEPRAGLRKSHFATCPDAGAWRTRR